MTNHSTQETNFIGRDALSPNIPKTEEAAEANSTEQAELSYSIVKMFDSFYDGYVEFASDPSPTYVYDIPAKHAFDAGVHREYDRAEVLAEKRAELENYSMVAFREGHLSIDPSLLAGETRPITTDIISEILVTDGIMRAQIRYDESHFEPNAAGLADLVSVETTTEQQETDTSFFEQMKHLGAKAFRAITLHSGELDISNDTTTKPMPIDDRGLLQHPAHREEVTQTIQQVKPW